MDKLVGPREFDADLHFCDGGDLTAQYLLLLDSINFCFWPDHDAAEKEADEGGAQDAAVQGDGNSVPR